MQPKVSIVLPCYNKEKWISGMFDTIIAQIWNNIELIIVNDGSTDGTRKIISKYIPIFLKRGFKPIVIDQENQGVAAAVRNGLMRITGEFICQVDADDELDTDYVSTMAGWLVEHPDDQWLVCDSYNSAKDRESLPYLKRIRVPIDNKYYPYKMFESFILSRVTRSVCVQMIRKSYMVSCAITETFCTAPRISQEPQIIIPLSLGGAQPIYISKPLYHYFKREDSIIDSMRTYKQRLRMPIKYNKLIKKSISVKKSMNKYDYILLEIGKIIHQYSYVNYFTEFNESKATKRLVGLINKYVGDNKKRLLETAQKSGLYIFARYFSNIVIGYNFQCYSIKRKKRGKIIAYAGLSKAANSIKIGLINSDICPDVFWDIAATAGSDIRGISIKKPQLMSLSSSDIILVLLKDVEIAKIIGRQLEDTPAKNNIWYFYDVLDYLTDYYYNEKKIGNNNITMKL